MLLVILLLRQRKTHLSLLEEQTFLAQTSSDVVSRLGLETCLETLFLKSRSRAQRSQASVSKDFGLGFELFVSRLCIGFFYEVLQEVP